MTQRVLKDVYRNLNFSKSRVILVDVVHTVLNAFSQRSQIYASEMLKKHGVEVLLGVGVKEVHPSYVVLTDGSTILTRTTIWAGGLKASKLSGALGIRAGHGDRIEVQPDFSVKDFPGVYALGDLQISPAWTASRCLSLHQSPSKRAGIVLMLSLLRSLVTL